MAIDKNLTGANSVAVNDTAGIKKYFRPGWMLFLVLGLCSLEAHADPSRHRDDLSDQYRYEYVSLDQYVPEGYTFSPVSLDDKGRVYGTVWSATSGEILGHVAIFDDKALTVIQHGVEVWVNTANNRGTLGGFVLLDPVTFKFQAGLFHDDQVELIPQQPGEIFAEVLALNDQNVALVNYYDEAEVGHFYLYHEGVSTPLDFGPRGVNTHLGGGGFNPTIALQLNNQGKIAGTLGNSFQSARAMRFDTSTGEAEQFNPLPSDTLTWSQGINKRGDVLGYSFSSPGQEHIGVWDRKGNFKTYFTESVPDFPTISNHLLFNDENLIVITGVSTPVAERGISYLVPRPGVRLNLAGLVENLPSSQKLTFIMDINKKGSMVGFGPNNFLLERINKRHHRGHH